MEVQLASGFAVLRGSLVEAMTSDAREAARLGVKMAGTVISCDEPNGRRYAFIVVRVGESSVEVVALCNSYDEARKLAEEANGQVRLLLVWPAEVGAGGGRTALNGLYPVHVS